MPGTAPSDSEVRDIAAAVGLSEEQVRALAARFFALPTETGLSESQVRTLAGRLFPADELALDGGLESGAATPETDGALLARLGTDAALWAREFCTKGWAKGGSQLLGELDPTPGGFLHVWLCNAIEAGRAAGYAQGRRDAEAEALRLVADLEGVGGMVPLEVARQVRDRLTGWPVPADFAGSEPPADSAASGLPANLAGSEPLARIAEALERIAATVSPGSTDGNGGWAAPYLRVTNA